MSKYIYLDDKEFVKEIALSNNRTEYVKISLLDKKEDIIKEEQGIITSGNININGDSSVRRTASLSAVFHTDTLDKDDFKINAKIEIEIGLQNNTTKYQEYPIIWFPQGIYFIKSPSISKTIDTISTSLNLSDKMSKLNGECGGTLPSAATLSEVKIMQTDGDIATEKLLIKDIIFQLVNQFGEEEAFNITINDIPDYQRYSLAWRGKSSIYLVDAQTRKYFVKERPAAGTYREIRYNDHIGYSLVPFVYPGKLEAQAGETVDSILSKIVQILGGNYEYFYNELGQFIFQQKNKESDTYIFEDCKMITSITSNPNYSSVKNDYVVWGKKKLANDASFPIRYHLAIKNFPKIEDKLFYVMEHKDGSITKVKVLDEETDDEGKLLYLDNRNYKIQNGNIYILDKEYGYVELVEEEHNLVYAIKPTNWREFLYLDGLRKKNFENEYDTYFSELEVEFPKMWNFRSKLIEEEGWKKTYTGDYSGEAENRTYFLDFIEPFDEEDNSVDTIGRRTMVQSNDGLTKVLPSDTLNEIVMRKVDITDEIRAVAAQLGYSIIEIDDSIYENISQGGTANSCYAVARELYLQNGSINNSITLNIIPLFHLQPNQIISLEDEETQIKGQYTIKSISLPLGIDGIMSLQCNKKLE